MLGFAFRIECWRSVGVEHDVCIERHPLWAWSEVEIVDKSGHLRVRQRRCGRQHQSHETHFPGHDFLTVETKYRGEDGTGCNIVQLEKRIGQPSVKANLEIITYSFSKRDGSLSDPQWVDFRFLIPMASRSEKHGKDCLSAG